MELIKNLVYNLKVWLTGVFDIDQNTIQIYNYKDIKLFGKNLINIALKVFHSVKQFKKHNIVFKITILDSNSDFLLVVFLNSYLVVCANEI